MKTGFTERDITPSTGMERPGGYGKAFHDGNVHDQCKVRAAVFDDGTTRVALVGADVLAVPRSLVVAVRRDVEAACGIPPQAVLIGASHTHSGGPTCMVQPGEFDHASSLVQSLAYEQSSCADAAYLDTVRAAMVEAIVEADDVRRDVSLSFGVGRESEVAHNRRWRMRNGLSYSHPGKGNPDIVEPAGPTDPDVGVIAAWDEQGRLLGCVVNFACHGTTGPGGTSADWIDYLERTVRGVVGAGAIAVFLNGACGDVTQVNNASLNANEFGEWSARFVGQRVGAEVLKVLASAQPVDEAPVGVGARVLRIPRRRPSADRVRQALRIVERGPTDGTRSDGDGGLEDALEGTGQAPAKISHTDWTFAKETLLLDAVLQREPVAEVEVQAIQVGPAVFLANPAEFFCQYGLDLKAGSPFPLTFPVELANGCVGYVPTEEAFGPHGGGYETRLTAYSNLEVTAGSQIVEGLLALARQRTPGPMPEPPKVAQPGTPWEYGAVPPDA